MFVGLSTQVFTLPPFFSTSRLLKFILTIFLPYNLNVILRLLGALPTFFLFLLNVLITIFSFGNSGNTSPKRGTFFYPFVGHWRIEQALLDLPLVSGIFFIEEHPDFRALIYSNDAP